MRFTYEDLEKRHSEMTARVICLCEAVTPLVGGMNATETGIRAFIKHHLKIEDPAEAQQAYERIMKEEIGERDVAPETGELKEQLTYGINVIRRNQTGPYLGVHMVHANIKVAMSRLGIFMEQRGSKGNVAECGVVRPHGISKLDDRPDCLYLIGRDGHPAQTYFDEFKGRVVSPKGSVSIIHHSECVPAGTRFEYDFAFLRDKMKDQDIMDWMAMSMIIGIGSVKSLGHGKFRILEGEILDAANPRLKETKEEKEERKRREKEAKEQITV